MASESKNDFTVLVVGATGNVGKAVVSSLVSKLPGVTVKAGTRDPTGDKAKALAALAGVTPVKADTASSIADEAKGAEFAILVPPGSEDRGEFGAAAAKAIAAAGVTKVISFSIPTTGSHMFARQFRTLDAGVRTANPGTILLKLPFFTENNWGHASTIKGMGKIFAPVPVNVPYSQVVLADAGDAAVAALVDYDKFIGQTFTLVSNVTSQGEIAAVFSGATGKEVVAVQVPPAAAKEALLGMGFPEWHVNGILELWAAISSPEVGISGTVNVRSTDLDVLLGRTGTTVAQWVEGVKAAFK